MTLPIGTGRHLKTEFTHETPLRKDIELISDKTSSTVANHHTTLPTLVGLGLALLGPFVFNWFIGPYLEAFAEPVTAILLGQGFLWLLVLGVIVLTASVTEEVLFRAYPLERVARLTGNMWLAAILSVAAFVAFLLRGWNMAHVWGAVLPLGAILTALYAWRRNLPFVIIVHFFIDLPLVLIAAAYYLHFDSRIHLSSVRL